MQRSAAPGRSNAARSQQRSAHVGRHPNEELAENDEINNHRAGIIDDDRPLQRQRPAAPKLRRHNSRVGPALRQLRHPTGTGGRSGRALSPVAQPRGCFGPKAGLWYRGRAKERAQQGLSETCGQLAAPAAGSGRVGSTRQPQRRARLMSAPSEKKDSE
jgi:hypothetical protein